MEQSKEPILEVKNLKKFYKTKTHSKLFNRKQFIEAVGGVDLTVNKGEILGIIGESGCGKTTLGKLIVNLEPATSGEIYFNNKPIKELLRTNEKRFRRYVQMVFQNPFDTFLQTETIEKIMLRPLQIYEPEMSREEQIERVSQILEDGGLKPADDFLSRYPHQLSGGQLQRISILRCMLLNPSFIVADEPVSMLDVSVRADVINMILDLRDKYHTSIAFISHDLSIVRYIADRIAVMYLGKIVETGTVDEIINSPQHPYTKALISNCTSIDFDTSREKLKIKGEIPSPINPGPGCYFAKRCYAKCDLCEKVYPEMQELGSKTHSASCHLLNKQEA